MLSRYEVLNKELNRIVDIVIKKYDPVKIILFGSLANGNVHEYSDIDLIVIVKESEKSFYERLEEIIQITMPKVATDILVYTPSEFNSIQERLFIKEEVLKKGQVIYSAK